MMLRLENQLNVRSPGFLFGYCSLPLFAKDFSLPVIAKDFN